MITLWGRNNSTNVKKVLWILEELALPYQHIMAGGQFGLNHDADYLAMNPNGLVPLLRDDKTELVLWESNAIVRYLAAQYGQPHLWADSPAVRAEGDKWMDWVSQTVSPLYRTIVIGLVRTPPEKRDQPAIDASIKACDSLLAIPDNALANQPWLSGNEFGIGDIAVAPFIYSLLNIGLTWRPLPHLERWYQQLCERPAFRKIVMIPVN